jgi:hypothetical protein
MGETRNSYKIFVGEAEGKRRLRRFRRERIILKFTEIGFRGVD